MQRMVTVLRHRGPDDQGIHVDGPIGLGMARLAVIDLSPAAHQPMSNEDGTIWIAYNGEVYNHREMRQELKERGHKYRSNSDTESILHAYEEWGEDCLRRLRGMYALAIWDARQRKLLLAGDRLGVKPLYYAQLGGIFLFASELKSILQHPAVRREVDLQSLDEYLRYSCVPAPQTIFKEVKRLLPAHYLVVKNGQIECRRYWELRFQPDFRRSEQEWIEGTRELLRMCVQDELESDVPLGTLLSGGVDSSSIVAFMSEFSSRPVKTFTIGFDTPGQSYGHFDETKYARKLAERFGCEHHEMVVEPKVLDVLPQIIWHFDEPFANVTAIPTWYLCKMTRQHVTVALSGVGGDEAFGGYPRYIAARFLETYFALPAVLRDGILRRVGEVIPQRADGYSILNRAQRFLLGARGTPDATYSSWASSWSGDSLMSLYSSSVRQEMVGHRDPTVVEKLLAKAGNGNLLNRIFYSDINTYLPDNLLTYSDRMSSAHSLEMRVPFCDHRLVEFAATVPPDLKLKGFSLKYLLKKALNDLLPHDVLYRRKQGFSVPLSLWLRNELQPLATVLLAPDQIRRRGYFDPVTVQDLLHEHSGGKADHSARLWALMVFELWHSLYVDRGIIEEPAKSLRELASPG